MLHTVQLSLVLYFVLLPDPSLGQDAILFAQPQRIDATNLRNGVDQCPSAEKIEEARNNITETVRGVIQAEMDAVRAANSPCGGFGWRQIAFFNMTDDDYNCPPELLLTSYSKRTCGKKDRSGRRCGSQTPFSVEGIPYSRVCGRILAYQYGYNIAFYSHDVAGNTLNGEYVSGISLTHGRTTREHIWTFAIGLFTGFGSPGPVFNEKCPCEAGNTIPSPDFVGDDYFCESGVLNRAAYSQRTFYPDQLLWDGQGCLSNSTCCELNNPPWFIKNLDTPTTDDIDLRICTYDDVTLSNTAIELLELYVQ